MPTICIIEDDEHIRNELATLLIRNEYEVYVCTRFDALVEEILALTPDIVLLDLNLPAVDGHVVCRELRSQSDMPIMVVTSRDNDLDELMSMNLGADDFVAKPYSPQILLARIASLLRRTQNAEHANILTYKGLECNVSRSMASFQGKEIELTKNESRILQTLMQHAETIVSRESMQNELWQSDQFIDDNTLTVNVNRLRMTLEKIGAKDFLHTKRGQGYCLLTKQ